MNAVRLLVSGACRSCLVAALAVSLSSCKLFGKDGEGAVDSDAATHGAATLTFIYDGAPALGVALSLELVADGELGTTRWRLARTPPSSSATLEVAADARTSTLVPDRPGDYVVAVETTVDGAPAEAETELSVREVAPYDPGAVERDDPDAPLDTIIGRIAGQAWVFSVDGSEDAVRATVARHPALSALLWDEIAGLLVAFDETSPEAAAALAALRSEPGIDSVAHRIHEGENAPRAERVPDDGSAFGDGGDNWHLERINAVAAWDDTIGATTIEVGVCDSGFDPTHEDLRGRFAELLTRQTDDHGMGVAGAIAARTDNRRGISGINWTSRIVAGLSGSEDLFRVARKTRVVNASWSMAGYVPETFVAATDADARVELTVERTRLYRNAARRAFKDTLFVFSGGNGIGNGLGNAGVYGVESRFNNGAIQLDDAKSHLPLDNVIVVAAMVADGRLAYYSQYGETVDLAAPTHYKSLRAGTSAYYSESAYGQPIANGSFSGTSAAAPVVTGVASLVLSANPDLEAHEVKTILVETASRTVTERHTGPSSGTAPLTRAIPIVDAEAAVDAAPAPTVVITVDPVSGLRTGDQAYFSAEIEHGLGPFVVTWDFGDGATSALRSDAHAFATAGVHTIEVTVVDLLGREAKARLQVSVADGGTVNGDGPTGNEDDFVIWYTANVACWDAPLIYITHRDNYEREELRSSFPGGGIDPEEKVEKRIFEEGFASKEAAQDWICPQINGWYPHYWCGSHYLINGDPYQVGALGCDLSDVPQVE